MHTCTLELRPRHQTHLWLQRTMHSASPLPPPRAQFIRSLAKGLRNLEELEAGIDTLSGSVYSASKQMTSRLRGIPAPPGQTIRVPLPVLALSEGGPTACHSITGLPAPRSSSDAGAGASASAGAVTVRRRSVPMLCSSMLLASQHFKACLAELLMQIEAGSQGATAWQLASAAVWHSFKICAMYDDSTAVAGKFCQGGMGEVLLGTLGRICSKPQVRACLRCLAACCCSQCIPQCTKLTATSASLRGACSPCLPPWPFSHTQHVHPHFWHCQ
jgi:hypothetical protein